MKDFSKNMHQRISTSFMTTGLALVILSLVALFYKGTLLCISTVFETFVICLLIQVVLWLYELIEIPSLILDIILRYTIVIGIVVAGGYLFQWLNQLPIIVLVIMTFVIYFLGCKIEISKVKTDIAAINHLSKES